MKILFFLGSPVHIDKHLTNMETTQESKTKQGPPYFLYQTLLFLLGQVC